MATKSLPQRTTVPTTTRATRGLQLFRSRGDEIRRYRGTVWSVPSCGGEGVYLVELTSGVCTCPDLPPKGESCKHVVAATVANAKSASCSGCGDRVPRRDLIEVTEDHESLTFFEGDHVCEDCALGAGVAL
jgi:hypothetical protein